MSHFAGQGLSREPFSGSPDPSFLLATRQHATCLQELEISLRLRRGLSVITGDIGTGKTTLCRCLLRAFAEDPATDVHLLLDPHFDTSEEFLRVILGSVSKLSVDPLLNLWQLKEALKQQLFRLGLVEKRLVILVIDEGQKISPENLEILREMLNYETNTAKLLQIVLFGQLELEEMIAARPNLADRINVRRRLTPLSFAETRRMIRHRLEVAAGAGQTPRISFTFPAMYAIHRAARGFPRKIVRLCHQGMLEMLVRGRERVGLSEARAAARPDDSARRPRRTLRYAGLAALCLTLGALWLSLGSGGPVLGPFGPFGASRGGVPTPGQVQEQPSSARPQPEAPAQNQQPEAREVRHTPEGLTLLPGPEPAEDQAAPASRLTLLPQRDQGPAVREEVGEGRPPLLHVTRASDAVEQGRRLAEKADFRAGAQ